ncbi:unnamed protein product [Gongylonema pulchrum]|uniref:Uncharacterized protein n=1 Tax=Gongylonema pulchrum TaxID=637853 RepID=A0A3P7QW23_9BILA|nr:unnamed protein product [Gongylonema pulchrum]
MLRSLGNLGETADFSKLFFFRKGRFQDPSQIRTKKRCFLFTKLLREVKSTRLSACSLAKSDSRRSMDWEGERQRNLYNVVRESLLSRIRATV